MSRRSCLSFRSWVFLLLLPAFLYIWSPGPGPASAAVFTVTRIGGALDGEAAFPGDNRRIRFTRELDGLGEVFAVQPDGSGETALTNDPAFDGDPAWSPDGSKIAFQSDRDGASRIWVQDFDSGEATPVSAGPADSSPDWQPLSPLQSDTDCDHAVDSADALMVLRDTAGLPHSAACIAEGDVDCDGDIDSVDGLFILRHVAGLPVTLPPGCGPIGE